MPERDSQRRASWDEEIDMLAKGRELYGSHYHKVSHITLKYFAKCSDHGDCSPARGVLEVGEDLTKTVFSWGLFLVSYLEAQKDIFL